MILANHPHLQGLVLGTVMLAVAAAGTPAALDAAHDLATMPPAVGKIATSDAAPKQSRTESPILIANPAP